MVNVVDITHLLDKEEGTAFDQDSILFAGFEDGGVFEYADDGFVHDMKEMLKVDGKAQTLESVLALPVRNAPWSIQKGRSSQAAYERIHRILTAPANNGGMSTPMNLVISQMCNAFIYRKAYFEKCWTTDTHEGRDVGFKYDKIAFRPPATCAVMRDAKTGAFRGFRQMPIRLEDTDEKKFKPGRAFVYIHGTHRDPMEGVSDLTVTQWCYKTKQKIRYLWYSFLEGQSLPKTVVKADDPTQATAAAKKLIGLRGGGVVGLEKSIEVDTLESNGRGAEQFKAALQWLDAEASSSVLAGFTDLGAAAAAGLGSFALSKDQTDFFLMSRQAVAKEMADYINQYLIADLMYWNFGPAEPAPYFEFGPIAQDDASTAIALLQATAQTPRGQSVLPEEFFDELTIRVAGFLELDVMTVREGIDRARKEAQERAEMQGLNETAQQVAGVKAAVDTVTNATQQKALAAVPDII